MFGIFKWKRTAMMLNKALERECMNHAWSKIVIKEQKEEIRELRQQVADLLVVKDCETVETAGRCCYESEE